MGVHTIEAAVSLSQPFISVVIPTFNRAKWVTRAVDSVLRQTFSDFEVLVIDDGSTDGTGDLLNSNYGERIKCITQENRGVSAARNAGIRAARGEWVAFLDSDDEWSSNYLERQVQYLGEALPSRVMQLADCRIISPGQEATTYFALNGSIGSLDGASYTVVERPFRFIIKHGPWQLGSAIILRSALIQAGLFADDLAISEDLDVMARVAVLGSAGIINEELVQVYRREEENKSLTQKSDAQPVRARETLEAIYKKLMQSPLDIDERRVVSGLLAANRRAMGNLLRDARDKTRALECYRQAFYYDRSLKSAGRYILSLLWC